MERLKKAIRLAEQLTANDVQQAKKTLRDKGIVFDAVTVTNGVLSIFANKEDRDKIYDAIQDSDWIGSGVYDSKAKGKKIIITVKEA